MEKNKINEYLDENIKLHKNKLEELNSLDDDCIGKSIFIKCETQVLCQLNEVKAFVNSGLVDTKEDYDKNINTVYCVCGNCDSKDMSLSGDSKYLICNNCLEKVYIRDLDIGFGEYKKQKDVVVENFICEECGELLPIRKVKILNGKELCSNCYLEENNK